MTKTEKSKKNLIILLIPPLLNYLNWKKELKNQYFSLFNIIDHQERLAVWKNQKSVNPIQWVEFLNNEVSDKIIEKILNLNQDRIILTNYPRNKESLQELEKELWIRGENQPAFFFVSFDKKLEADFVELQTENIICPICENSWQ